MGLQVHWKTLSLNSKRKSLFFRTHSYFSWCLKSGEFYDNCFKLSHLFSPAKQNLTKLEETIRKIQIRVLKIKQNTEFLTDYFIYSPRAQLLCIKIQKWRKKTSQIFLNLSFSASEESLFQVNKLGREDGKTKATNANPAIHPCPIASYFLSTTSSSSSLLKKC